MTASRGCEGAASYRTDVHARQATLDRWHGLLAADTLSLVRADRGSAARYLVRHGPRHAAHDASVERLRDMLLRPWFLAAHYRSHGSFVVPLEHVRVAGVELIEQGVRTAAQAAGRSDDADWLSCADLLADAGLHAAAADVLSATGPSDRRALARLPHDPLLVPRALRLVDAWMASGRLQEAEQYARDADSDLSTALGPEADPVLEMQTLHAVALYALGRVEDALSRIRPVVAQRRQRADAPDALDSLLMRFSQLLAANGLHDEAARIEEEAARSLEERHGASHPDVIRLRGRKVARQRRLRDLSGAERDGREVLALATRVFGADHPATLVIANTLGLTLRDAGRFEEAEDLLRASAERLRARRGSGHPSTLVVLNSLASVLQLARRFADARATYATVAEAQRELLGDHHPETLDTLENIATLHVFEGDLTAARAGLERVLAARRAHVRAGHPSIRNTLSNLHFVLEKTGLADEAVRVERELQAADAP